MTQKALDRSEHERLTLMQLFEKFPDNQSAEKWFEAERWKDGQFCPYCGSLDIHKVQSKNPLPYRCPDCRKCVTVRVGTVMHRSKVALRQWAIAIYMLATSLKGVSSMKLHRDIGVTQKMAWMMAQKIRQGWMIGSKGLSGEIESDETYISEKRATSMSRRNVMQGAELLTRPQLLEQKTDPQTKYPPKSLMPPMEECFKRSS